MELVLFSMLWVQGSLCILSHTHVVILYKLISKVWMDRVIPIYSRRGYKKRLKMKTLISVGMSVCVVLR